MASLAALCVVLVGPLGSAPDQLMKGQPPAAWARGSYSRGDRTNKDPISLLQYALPLEESLGKKTVEVVRALQKDIEIARYQAQVRLWEKADSAASDALNILGDKNRRKDLLKPINADRK